MKKIDAEILGLLEKEKKVTLGFSAGKDSLSCAVVLRNLNVEYIPFYFYHCPDLEFVEEILQQYEKILKVKVIRLPHPMLYDCLRHEDFQTYDRAIDLESNGFIRCTFRDLINVYLDSINAPRDYYDVNGVRAAESFNRRMVIKNNGPVDHKNKKISLISDWTNKDVKTFLKQHNIPLSMDYDIWDRSFDGIKYQFLFGVKKHHPRDWQTLLEYFPLLELELFRYEKNTHYYAEN